MHNHDTACYDTCGNNSLAQPTSLGMQLQDGKTDPCIPDMTTKLVDAQKQAAKPSSVLPTNEYKAPDTRVPVVQP